MNVAKENNSPALEGNLPETLRFALQYAILAPSSHNTQPWGFVMEDEAVLVCADRTRALPVIDSFDRELIISCGAALLNLRSALSHFAWPYEITLFPSSSDPDVLARVRLSPTGFEDKALGRLCTSIQTRSTNRSDFIDAPVPHDLQEEMRAAASVEGATLTMVQSEAERETVAELIAEGDRNQFSDARFRRELAAWLHSSRRNDGMPAYSQGGSELLNSVTPVVSAVIRTFDVGGGIAAAHGRLAKGSPLLACLSTEADNAEAWLVAGQALERVLLVAADRAYDASYLNQPIEVAALRPRLREIMSGEAFPQVLLRIGRGVTPALRAPRRPLQDVIW